MDTYLLSHLIAEHHSRLRSDDSVLDYADPIQTFRNLMPHLTAAEYSILPLCLDNARRLSDELVVELHSRFPNNNFVIHSYLDSIGHGIFPLASRLFNHSCTPNAVVTYSLNTSRPTAVLRTLAQIDAGDEVSKCFWVIA